MTRSNKHKPEYKWFPLYIRKQFWSVLVMEHWDSLPREAVEFYSWKYSKVICTWSWATSCRCSCLSKVLDWITSTEVSSKCGYSVWGSVILTEYKDHGIATCRVSRGFTFNLDFYSFSSLFLFFFFLVLYPSEDIAPSIKLMSLCGMLTDLWSSPEASQWLSKS